MDLSIIIPVFEESKKIIRDIEAASAFLMSNRLKGEIIIVDDGSSDNTSSVFALGAPPGRKGWPLTLSRPLNPKQTLLSLNLRDQALSGSGLQKGRHIIDPRSARPVQGNLGAWAWAAIAATSDALSTAFMIMSSDEVEKYCLRNQDVLAMILTEEEGRVEAGIQYFGSWDKFSVTI